MFKPSGIIALTTDFQEDSFYIAEMKVAAYQVARDALIVDVTHAIPPQDVRHASWVLLRALESFPEGTVHVCVVDPGVGTDRKIVAVLIHGQVIIGPDNGLFDVVASRYPVRAVVDLNNEVYFGPRHSATFHGRDVMAPAAAHLVRGIPLESLGEALGEPLITPEKTAGLLAHRDGNVIEGEFILADSFGNMVTNIFAEDIPEEWNLRTIRIEFEGQKLTGLVSTYGDREPGEVVALLGSTGQLEVAIVQGDAAQKCGLRPGIPVKIVCE